MNLDQSTWKNQLLSEKNALILDSLRNGGEIIADGSVVVCGNTEGKIIAGVKDPNAYILCLNFNAELVSINGVYSKGYDLIDYSNKKVLIQLNLEGESLEIKELDNQ